MNPSTLVDSCVACHLRKHALASTHDFRCRLCVNFETFSEYQHTLFSEDRGNVKEKVSRTGRNRQMLKFAGNRKRLTVEEERTALLQEEEELLETTGHVDFHQIYHDSKMLRDSESETSLRQLLMFARINRLEQDILHDGTTQIKLFDALKKESKVIGYYYSPSVHAFIGQIIFFSEFTNSMASDI